MGRKMEATVIGALAVFAFFAENYRSNKNLKKEYYTISSGKLPKEFDKKKILFLSDLHNARFGKNNKRLLEAIEKENPDYIFDRRRYARFKSGEPCRACTASAERTCSNISGLLCERES